MTVVESRSGSPESEGAGGPRSKRRSVVWWFGLVVVLLAVVLVAGGPEGERAPLDPRSTAPDGTAGLVRVLRRLDSSVELSSRVPDENDGETVVLVLRDELRPQQSDQLLAWVRRGGRVVVVDPGSSLLASFDTADLSGAPNGADGSVVTRGICTLDALGDATTLDVGPFPAGFRVGAEDRSCFGRSGVGFVVVSGQGPGAVVAVGGADWLTNEYLARADNAVTAVALVAPRAGDRVVILSRAQPGEGSETLADLVPTGVKAALVQAFVAFGCYVLWRARRLGRPVLEPQPVHIAGSELVQAVARLMDRAGHVERAAELLRGDLRRLAANRLGVAVDAPPETLAAALAEADARAGRSGWSRDGLLGVLTLPVRDEAELVELAQRVQSIREELL